VGETLRHADAAHDRRCILPAAFAIAMGVLVGAVQRGDALAGPLAFAGSIFVLLQVLSPIHQAVSANLGDRTAAAQTFFYDPFGNLNKSASPFSFQPTYNAKTNRMTSIGSFTLSLARIRSACEMNNMQKGM
jgi:hypothetical protein